MRSIVRLLVFGVWMLVAALLAACSLAAPAPLAPANPQAQPPTAGQPAAAAQQAAQPLQLPSRHPNVANGAALYQQKCVRCHGDTGRGDGAMASQIQTQFGSPVADLTSDVIARAKTPEQWYDAVSNGRMDKGMPPFSGSLNADQRWDVIAFVWSLAATPDQIAAGKAVYQDQCAHCHGDQGKGDGKDAAGKLADLSDFAALAKVAPGLWDQALASGHVPSYAGTLSEDKRRAAIDYVRTFAYDATASAASAAAPATTPGGPTGPIKIEGTIINGTAGQSVPDNLPMTLYLLPHQSSSQDMITRTFQSGVAGLFAITETQNTTTSLLAVGVEYKDLKFYSEVAPSQPQVTLPITVYESTSDTANVKIDTLHIVVEPGPTGLNVSEIYVISNNGDRFVAGFGKPVLHFGLPADATNLQLDPGLQQVVNQNGDGLDYYDAIPVGSQAQQLVYQYTLPLTATSLSRAIYQPIAAVNLLLSGQSTDVVVTSDVLKSAGVQTMPSTGQTFQQYSASDLKPGTNLAVSVSTSSQPTLGTAAQPFDWRILLGIALVVVGAIGLVIWQRGQRKQPVVAAVGANSARSAAIRREVLIDQIAALDDDFAEGKLDEINYQAKRTKLKQQLMKLMEEE